MQVGRYEIIRTLGAGGTAKVFLAKSANGREVVLKVPLSSNPDHLERVRDEARVGLRLQHPCIVETLDLFEHDGRPILVVEYVDGVTIAQARKVGALPPAAVVKVGRQISEALTALHDATDENNRSLGMLHRDVTGANILLSRRGDAKLIDLGIARSVETQARQTQAGAIRGTVRYLAPELLDGKKHSPATDLWALGIVLFEAALGRPALEGDDRSVLTAILMGEVLKYRPGEAIDPRLHDALAALIAKEEARLQRAMAAANIMRRLEVAFGDGGPGIIDVVERAIAGGHRGDDNVGLSEHTKNVLNDSSTPRPVTIPPPQSRVTGVSGVTDPRAATIDAEIDDDRAATVRMRAVNPISIPVGAKSLSISDVAPVSTEDLSSVSGRYSQTDVMPAVNPSPMAPGAATEPAMRAVTLPTAPPVRAVPLTQAVNAPAFATHVSSSIETAVDDAAASSGFGDAVIPLEPDEPTAAGLASQYGNAPTMIRSDTVVQPAMGMATGEQRDGFRPPAGAVHSDFADPTREGGHLYMPPVAPASAFADSTKEASLSGHARSMPSASLLKETQLVHGGLGGRGVIGPTGTAPAMPMVSAATGVTPTANVEPTAVTPESGPLPSTQDATNGDPTPRPLPGPPPPSSTPLAGPPTLEQPATTPLVASPSSTGLFAGAASAPPPSQPSDTLIAPAVDVAPPPEASSKSATGPRDVKATPQAAMAAAAATLIETAAVSVTPAPAVSVSAGTPAPSSKTPKPSVSDGGFQPSVTQAFYLKDMQSMLREAEVGSPTLEMQAIKTPSRVWVYIGGALAVLAVILVAVIVAYAPDEKPPSLTEPPPVVIDGPPSDAPPVAPVVETEPTKPPPKKPAGKKPKKKDR